MCLGSFNFHTIHVGLRVKVQNTGYFNGATYFIPGIKILELLYLGLFVGRPLLTLKHSECCEGCTGYKTQLTSKLVNKL